MRMTGEVRGCWAPPPGAEPEHLGLEAVASEIGGGSGNNRLITARRFRKDGFISWLLPLFLSPSAHPWPEIRTRASQTSSRGLLLTPQIFS